MRSLRRLIARLALPLLLALVVAACGGSSEASTPSPDSSSEPGVRVISVDDAAATLDSPPDGLVVLDVRTPEEFAEARLEGAVLIDIYEDDFADRIAELDRDVPYLLYCRSGNRSAQARELMEQLDFADVRDIDGGILSWTQANLPVVSG